MPTWFTGELVVTRIARSAALLPRNSHRSPVRVSSTAASSGIEIRSRIATVCRSRRYGAWMRWWKVLGLAGVAGVAATGVVVARRERARRAFTPEQVRDRLHERYAALADDGDRP